MRPVFDASASGLNGVSLNDCMQTGTYLTANLLEVLLRFRRCKYALTADISKAFLQIQVKNCDRDVHRFLLKERESMRIMRMVRVPFGNTASPFLLNATIKCHLSKQQASPTVSELSTNLYVDDWLTGADSVTEVKTLKEEATAIMDKASMPLSKWCSNCAEISDQTQPSGQVFKEKERDTEQHKVLGMLWIPKDDCFSFEHIDVSPHEVLVTKILVLSLISRVFDPMGFLQSFLMTAKVLFQNLWRSGLDWDDRVPEQEEAKFLKWRAHLPFIGKFSIPRSLVNLSWKNKQDVELHVFGDASEQGYGSCVYIRVVKEDGTIHPSLLMAKARLAPVKKVTLPRLELMAALLSARLVTYVKKALMLPQNTVCRCWTDSMVTLQWIQSDAGKWKTFVANRITEIQALTSPECWRHCPGAQNPADLLTRGTTLDSVTTKLWLRGPHWLMSNINPTPVSLIAMDDHAGKEEECEVSAQMSASVGIEPLFPVERWGTLSKAIQVCAFVLRFINNAKTKICSNEMRRGELTIKELRQANTLLLIDTQKQYFTREIVDLNCGKLLSRQSILFRMKPFLDENGLLRMNNRLTMSTLSYDEKYPIILPGGHLSRLIVRQEHLILKNAGVSQMLTALRNRFWIIRLRSIAKQVKNQCMACSRHDRRLPAQDPAPLPRERIERSNPFMVTGMDYCGPLYTADFVGHKFYVLLFTCAVKRAVHIELVNSLSLVDFMLAFKRFTARRGMPNTLVSDNAKTFRAGSLQLIRELGERCPKWQFITPRAPWCGGFWERLVKSVKLSLKKSLGLGSQTRAELECTLHQIEACINSRPLTAVHDDVQNVEPLTPLHFLFGRSDCPRPSNDSDVSLGSGEMVGRDLRVLFQSQNKQLHHFWRVWQKDYIRNLPLLKHTGVNKEPFIGNLCLIKSLLADGRYKGNLSW